MKSQKHWIVFGQLFGYLRSIFNAESHHIIVAKSITITSVVSKTLTALQKPIYHHLSYAIFYRNHKKTLDFFRQLLSIFNAEILYVIAIKAITIKSVVLKTLIALWKLLYHCLSYAIFWQNRKNVGVSNLTEGREAWWRHRDDKESRVTICWISKFSKKYIYIYFK